MVDRVATYTSAARAGKAVSAAQSTTPALEMRLTMTPLERAGALGRSQKPNVSFDCFCPAFGKQLNELGRINFVPNNATFKTCAKGIFQLNRIRSQ